MADPRKIRWRSPEGAERTAWQVDYKNAAGKRRKKQFPRQKDAVEWLKTYEAKKRKLSIGDFTVSEAAQAWLDACERGLNGKEPVEPATHRHYEAHVRLHILPNLGGRKLSELSGPDVQRFIGELHDKGMSRPMQKKVLTSLKSILNEAVRQGNVDRNAAIAFRMSTSGRHKKEPEIPSREEARRLIQKLDELARQPDPRRARSWRRYRAMFLTLVHTGMRASELRGLNWASVDLKDCFLKVNQRATEKGILGSPKSKAGWRTIHLPKLLVGLLREWHLECPPGHKQLVFPNFRGNVENHSNIYRRGWGTLQEEAGVVNSEGRRKYTMHALRHFRASILIAGGATPKEVMVEMGHSSIKITFDVYGHLFPEDISKQQQRADTIAAKLLA